MSTPPSHPRGGPAPSRRAVRSPCPASTILPPTATAPVGITEPRSVVLVEDDVDNRESISEALEAEYFAVHALATADEALKLLDVAVRL